MTDYQGNQYEHVEYTPYGESWIDQESDSRALLPYKFTSKELDSETGLYYYGARYLNPRTSRWVSADPAMDKYLPVAPISDDARKHNQSLPGEGGAFNLVNLADYHYAGNSPVSYSDPNGRFDINHAANNNLILETMGVMNMVLVPLGSGLTERQMDATQLRKLLDVGTGRVPGDWSKRAGTARGGINSVESLDPLKIAKWGLGYLLRDSKIAGAFLAWANFAEAISQRPGLVSSNYLKPGQDLEKMVFIEQLFANDVVDALNGAGMQAKAEYYSSAGGAIANIITVISPYDEKTLHDLIVAVKESKEIYKDVQINDK